jgi:hypothetical protein
MIERITRRELHSGNIQGTFREYSANF